MFQSGPVVKHINAMARDLLHMPVVMYGHTPSLNIVQWEHFLLSFVSRQAFGRESKRFQVRK
jgi:hypothetical protein